MKGQKERSTAFWWHPIKIIFILKVGVDTMEQKSIKTTITTDHMLTLINFHTHLTYKTLIFQTNSQSSLYTCFIHLATKFSITPGYGPSLSNFHTLSIPKKPSINPPKIKKNHQPVHNAFHNSKSPASYAAEPRRSAPTCSGHTRQRPSSPTRPSTSSHYRYSYTSSSSCSLRPQT